jgi:hypothetical protein
VNTSYFDNMPLSIGVECQVLRARDSNEDDKHLSRSRILERATIHISVLENQVKELKSTQGRLISQLQRMPNTN